MIHKSQNNNDNDNENDNNNNNMITGICIIALYAHC
jgi:hypothetical protein